MFLKTHLSIFLDSEFVSIFDHCNLGDHKENSIDLKMVIGSDWYMIFYDIQWETRRTTTTNITENSKLSLYSFFRQVSSFHDDHDLCVIWDSWWRSRKYEIYVFIIVVMCLCFMNWIGSGLLFGDLEFLSTISSINHRFFFHFSFFFVSNSLPPIPFLVVVFNF